MIGTPSGTHEPRRNPLPMVSGWCFVLFAAAALGYGLWALYGSGESVGSFDVRAESPAARYPASAGSEDPTCPTFGPIALDPQLGPFRAVLHTGYAPVGSRRLRYEVAMLDAEGRTLWDQRGALGSSDDEASFVRHVSSLIEFELAEGGAYTFQVRFGDGSMDHLREASLDLRGGIVRVDTRITWGFGLAAFACLFVNLMASRRDPYAYEMPEEEFRDAA